MQSFSQIVFRALKASKSIPFITAGEVVIDNIAYIDGSISATFGVNIEKAIAEGADNIIVINDAGELSWTTKIFWHTCSWFSNKNIKKVLTEYCRPSAHRIGTYCDINMIVIEPSKVLRAHSLDNNKEHLTETFDLGFEDLKNSIDFRVFISKYLAQY